MNALPVRLLLLIEEGVFVLGQHLLLTRHFGVPSLDSLHSLVLASKSCADGVNDLVDVAQTLALPGLLGRRETPRGLPVREKSRVSVHYHESDELLRVITREDPRTGTAWA